MRQAIQTKYIGPTNTKGSRIKATAFGGSVTVSYDDALSQEKNHQAAAIALAEKLGWSGAIHGGGTLTGYVFVFPDCDIYVIPEPKRGA